MIERLRYLSCVRMKRRSFLAGKGMNRFQICLVSSLLSFSTFASAIAADKHTFEAEKAAPVAGASKIADRGASGRASVALMNAGQGIKFSRLPAAGKLAIRYASVTNGTISVSVNDQPARKVNVHSSGAFTNSFLNAIIDLAIPAKATLTISLGANDVAVNIDKIIVGNGDLGLPPDIWNLPPLPVAAGPYAPDWREMSRLYQTPEWWRDAKFGAWAHWDPQSMPEDGDWYARGMYQEGSQQYRYHTNHFGYPSEYGYKDIAHNWVIDRWKPKELMDLYVEMGARYFMAMGNHHDNFDNWNSKYQPWNSVNVGPKVDIVGTWEKAARAGWNAVRHRLSRLASPDLGPIHAGALHQRQERAPMKGVPYDALQTILDGKGKWWKGMDPVDLYGPPHTMPRGSRRPENDPLLSPFANQFMWRVDDAVTKYHPDVIYFDEAAGDTLVDLGVNMGLGFLAPPLVANFYNKSLKWNDGKMDVVINLKCIGGRYNSFKNNPELIPIVERALVKSSEATIEPTIMAYPFQTETTIQDWHYRKGQRFIDAKSLVQSLMQNVSRNGTMLLNLTQHGRGDLDPQVIQIAKDIGAWLKVNGEAVYASRPFEVCEENNNAICYTRNNGNVYAALMNWNDGPIRLKFLRAGGATLGKVSKVEMLGSDIPMIFAQDEQGLTVTPGGPVQPLSGITNQSLATMCRVLRITHDKDWINDDDPGATYPGWVRRCNLGTGDFNNDLTISETPGNVWSCSFTGTSVSVIAPKEAGAGKIEVQIDGQTRAGADLSATGARLAQQTVCEVTGLAPGKHAIAIIHRGPGPVAVDALVVR